MGEEAANFIGDRVVPEFVEDSELLYWRKTPAQEKIREFKEVRQKSNKPTEPRIDGEGLSVLKKEEDNENAGGKVDKQFLNKSVLMTFDFFGKALAKVPVGNIVFEKVGSDD